MEWLIKLVFAFMLVVVIMRLVDYYMHERMNAGLIRVQATSDLATYYVKDLPNKEDAAELLARTRQKLFDVITHMSELPDSEIPPRLLRGVRRIVSKHCHDIQINELDATEHESVAMNRKKGQEIHVCLRQCPDCVDLTQEDRLFIVALHELAHSATKGYDPSVDGITQHGDEFKRYEYYVISIAQGMGLINSDAVIGTNYCGVDIPDITNPP